MGIYQRWMNLPFKARIYVGASTFAIAFAADYVLGRLEEEAQARKRIEAELNKS